MSYIVSRRTSQSSVLPGADIYQTDDRYYRLDLQK